MRALLDALEALPPQELRKAQLAEHNDTLLAVSAGKFIHRFIAIPAILGNFVQCSVISGDFRQFPAISGFRKAQLAEHNDTLLAVSAGKRPI